jgi:hypothetical protein
MPVVSIIWSYNGLDATDMAWRIVTVCERSLTTTANDIDHIESSSLAGVGVIKLYGDRLSDSRRYAGKLWRPGGNPGLAETRKWLSASRCVSG